MGITIGLLNVRRSILINALPQRVWCEFEAFDRIGAWFGQGHELHQFELKLGGQVDLSVAMDGKRRHFGGPVVVFRARVRGFVREQLGTATRLARFNILHPASDAGLRSDDGRDLPSRLRAIRCGRRRYARGLRRGLGRQASEISAGDR